MNSSCSSDGSEEIVDKPKINQMLDASMRKPLKPPVSPPSLYSELSFLSIHSSGKVQTKFFVSGIIILSYIIIL
jgi:hypothetical protein